MVDNHCSIGVMGSTWTVLLLSCLSLLFSFLGLLAAESSFILVVLFISSYLYSFRWFKVLFPSSALTFLSWVASKAIFLIMTMIATSRATTKTRTIATTAQRAAVLLLLLLLVLVVPVLMVPVLAGLQATHTSAESHWRQFATLQLTQTPDLLIVLPVGQTQALLTT